MIDVIILMACLGVLAIGFACMDVVMDWILKVFFKVNPEDYMDD